MSRVLVLLSLVTLAAMPLAGMAAAQEHPLTVARRAPQPLDLPAIVLYPRDLDAIGLPGFGIVQTYLTDAETQADLDLLNDDDGAAELVAAYRDSGFGHRYRLSLLRPRIPVVETEPGVYQGDVRIVSSVTEFASAEGAALAFPVIEDERGDETARDVPGAPVFGEQSEVTHYGRVGFVSGDPYKELNLTFRVGNLIGDISVLDHTDAEPKMATAAALGEALLAKIERARAQQAALRVPVVRGQAEKANSRSAKSNSGRAEPAPGPGLSWRMLRLTPDADRLFRGFGYDGYVRLDGQLVPEFATLAEAIQESGVTPTPAAPTPSAKTAGPEQATAPIAAYHYFTPLGEGDPAELPFYRVQLRLYPSAEAAAGPEGMVRYRDWLRQPPEAGGPVIERDFAEADFGDEAFAVWEGSGEGGAVTSQRYVIYARYGAMLVVMDIVDLPPDAEAPATEVAALIGAQAECLRADLTAWCEPAAPPVLSETGTGFA